MPGPTNTGGNAPSPTGAGGLYSNPGAGALGPAGPVGPPKPPPKPPERFDLLGPPDPNRPAASKAADAQDYMARLLTQSEKTKYMQASTARNAAIAAAQQKAKELASFAKLRLQGAEGIRAQQALLSRNGHAVTVDGKFGPQTQQALTAYLAEQQTKLNAPLHSTFSNASPITIRAASNATLDAHIGGKRDYIQKYAEQQLLDIEKKIAGTTHAPGSVSDETKKLNQAQAGYEDLIKALHDPIHGMDNVAVDDTFKKLSGQILGEANAKMKAAIEAADTGSLWSKKRWLDATTVVLGAISRPFTDTFGAALASGLDVHMTGGNFAEQFQAEFGSIGNLVRIPGTDLALGGLIAPAGSTARKSIEDTNTQAERAALVQSGDALSPGQAILGDYTPQFAAKHGDPVWHVPELTIKGAHITSGLVDLSLIAFKDPTILAAGALKGVTEIGTHAAAMAVRDASPELVAGLTEQLGTREAAIVAIEQQGRRAFIDQAVNGRLLQNGIGDVLSDLSRTSTVKDLRAAIPGLDEATATAAIDARAAAEGGAEAGRYAAQKVVVDAFVAGKYNPHIGPLRQALNAFGEHTGLSGIGVEGGLGRKAIAASDRLTFIRNLAAPKGATASTFEHDSTDFISRAIETASEAGGATWRTAWDTTVKDAVHGLDLGGDSGRFYRLVDAVHELNSPAMQAAFEGVIRPYMANPDSLKNIPLASYMEAIFSQDGIDEAIRKLEVGIAIARGDFGEKAALQFNTDLARGYLLEKNFDRKLTATAAKNVGLSLGPATAKGVTVDKVEKAILDLPQELRATFEARLEKLGGKTSGLGTLARDINLATYNRDLQEEMIRLLGQTEGRAELMATFAPTGRAGLGSGTARRVLDATAIVAPTELRFKYKTANEQAHAALRSVAVARYVEAFQVPAVVENALIREAASVKTETQLFAVAERMVRASLEAKGIDNPDAIMQMLRERGDFIIRKSMEPVRSLDELGEPVADLQTLAQRIESVRLPTPSAIAIATRKAILDGVQDSSLAQRLATRLEVVADHVGDIHIRITKADGSQFTLRQAAHTVHRMWKFLIVTNAGMPLVGAAAGFIGSNGNVLDRLKGAGLGFALGSLGTTRYIFRVVGLEDRFRMFLADGFSPDNMIPGYAKMRTRRYANLYGEDPYRRFVSDDVTKIGNYGVSHFENDTFSHVDKGWEALASTDSRAPDAWWRIVNFQIHPESDPVMAILLREQAGHLGGTDLGTETTTQVEQLVKRPVEQAAGEVTAKPGYEALGASLTDALGSGSIDEWKQSNENLLTDFPNAETKSFYRGEPAANLNASRGNFFSERESYAEKFAGHDGIVYKIDLPVDAHGIPLVGELAPAPDAGWVLAGEHAAWAEAADPIYRKSWELTTATKKTAVLETGQQEADRLIVEFLSTEEGALWKERWATALKGGKPKAAVERMRAFLEKYSTPELAEMRVAGGAEGRPGLIDRDTLKRQIKAGIGPDAFHAQASWKFPRSMKDILRSGNEVVNKLVLSGPSNFLNRRPWANAIFAKEYDRLVLNGVDRAEAQQIADNFARQRVNSILHRFDEPTRFAAKIDIFAPFQHAREDIFRAYSNLAVENPLRTFRVVEGAARAFNNGKTAGIFTHNDFTGEWQMSIPGAARLSHSLFQVPFEVNFDANIKDMLFVGNGAYGIGILPAPGGPYWSVFSRELADHYPEVFQGNWPLHEWLFGFGPQGNLMRADTSRLWMAFTGETPPWEFDNQANWKNQLNRWQHEVGQELMYQHRLKGGDPNWTPTDAELNDAVGKFFKAWAFFGTTFPASSYPVLTNRDNFYAAENAFTAGGLRPWDAQAFLAKYPEYTAYLADGSPTKYIGPDDVATLKRLKVGNRPDSLSKFNPDTGQWEISKESQQAMENTGLDQQLGFRRYESWGEFKDQFKTYQRTSQYYRAVAVARQTPDLAARERAIVAANKKYSDVVGVQNRNYDIKKEIHNILRDYPKQLRDSAFQRVRSTYGLSNVDLRKAITSAQQDPTWEANPWVGARYGIEVDAAVRETLGTRTSGTTLEHYVAQLRPAEQARYWQYQMNALGYDPDLDNPANVLNRYKYFQKQYYGVRDSYPALYKATTTWKNPFREYVSTLKSDTSAQVSATFDAIDRISAEVDAAAVAKNWTAYDALKAKRNDMYDLAAAFRDHFLGKLPDLTKYYDDLHAATIYDHAGNGAAAANERRMALMDRAGAPYVLTSEQTKFLHMPPAVQRAYATNLVDALDMPAGKLPYDVSQYVKETTGLHKLFWDYLTPVQQDIMAAMHPDQIDAWKYQAEFYLRGPGLASKANHFKGATLSEIPSELRYAHALLGKYDKRGGKSAPKSYSEYLALPAHPAVKAEWLQRHQDVKEWLSLGPLANMDPHMRDYVTNTLVKYGNFQSYGGRGGHGKSWYGVHAAGASKGFNGDPGPKGSGYADYKWAKYQLYAWSHRDNANKPATYDLWVNMPSGKDKKLYLEQHPEIGQWIRMGAMANMPEDYRNVVRDILQQYGDWTAQQDPLGTTISQFYATPGYGRDQFLLNHPELEAYWALTRTPTETAMFNLQNDYFKIPDIQAKRAFLGAHPELQQHFLDSRARRYEKFLNQVAAYMGANPAMFTDYLNRQQDVLAELLRRYASPPLIREAGPSDVTMGTTTDSGRTRQPNRRAAA